MENNSRRPQKRSQCIQESEICENHKSSVKKAKNEVAGDAVKLVSAVSKRKNERRSRKISSKKPSMDCLTVSKTYSHWLVKSEPESRIEKGVEMKFSIDDLQYSQDQTTCWDGVRNYQARNFLRDHMKLGHDVFFYHSNCKNPGIVGICKVVKESYPDHTQFDSKNPHFDSSSDKDNPRWFMVDVKYVRLLKRFISLAELKQIYQDHVKNGGPLQNMSLFARSRLSVQPLSDDEWNFIIQLEDNN